MESVVLQPAAGQTVVATEQSEKHHGHHRSVLDEAILREQAAGFRIAAQDSKITDGYIKDTITSVKDARYDVVSKVTDAGTASALASCKTDDGVSEVGKDIALGQCKTDDKIGDTYALLQKQLSDTATATVVGFKDSEALAYQVEGRALLEAAKNFNAISVQNDRLWYQTNLQAQAIAAASVLLATQNQAALAAQIAECCCKAELDAEKTRNVVHLEGERTRDLINTLELGNANRRTAKAEQALAAYFAAKAAPTVPVI